MVWGMMLSRRSFLARVVGVAVSAAAGSVLARTSLMGPAVASETLAELIRRKREAAMAELVELREAAFWGSDPHEVEVIEVDWRLVTPERRRHAVLTFG